MIVRELVAKDGALVFRDPHGRPIPNTTAILDQQLDLQPGTGPPGGLAEKLLNDLGG